MLCGATIQNTFIAVQIHLAFLGPISDLDNGQSLIIWFWRVALFVLCVFVIVVGGGGGVAGVVAVALMNHQD